MKNPNQHLFHYCPRCGKETLAASSRKSFLCRTCNFQFYLNNAVAGIALIFNPKKELLVTRRRHDPGKGTLDFPGGFAEHGETIEQTLIREVKEELNLDITALTYFCSAPNTYRYKDITYSITDFAFLCTVQDFTGIKSYDDVSSFYFMELAGIDKNKFGLDSPKIIFDRLLEKY